MNHLQLKNWPIILILLISHWGYGQVLHTENLNVILDTSRLVKGNFSPNFRYRNLKEDYIEIGNTADVSVQFKNHGFTIANRLEFARFGNENLMSGGFLYIRYLNIQSKIILFEPFFQMHWSEVRGLDRKYAGGLNMRWRAVFSENTGLFVGLGSLYEYERWNYSGVSDPVLIPADPNAVEIERFRGTSYMSLKRKFGELFNLDVSLYYQPTFSAPFKDYRLASSFEVTYNLSQLLGLSILYQNIYDTQPLVPIDKLFNDVNLGLTFSF